MNNAMFSSIHHFLTSIQATYFFVYKPTKLKMSHSYLHLSQVAKVAYKYPYLSQPFFGALTKARL